MNHLGERADEFTVMTGEALLGLLAKELSPTAPSLPAHVAAAILAHNLSGQMLVEASADLLSELGATC